MTDTSVVCTAPGVLYWLVPPPLAVWAPAWWSAPLGHHLCPP